MGFFYLADYTRLHIVFCVSAVFCVFAFIPLRKELCWALLVFQSSRNPLGTLKLQVGKTYDRLQYAEILKMRMD